MAYLYATPLKCKMSRKNLAWFMENKWFLYMILNEALCKGDASQLVKTWGIGGCLRSMSII